MEHLLSLTEMAAVGLYITHHYGSSFFYHSIFQKDDEKHVQGT